MSQDFTSLQKLNALLAEVWAHQSFYASKWKHAGLFAKQLKSLAELASFPLTTRRELLDDQLAAPPLGTNRTLPLESFQRFHRTSGTTRAPLLWADSTESWQWVVQGSQRLWQLAGVRPADRVLLLMSFGASSGPWIMHAGLCRLGAACFVVGQAEADEQLRWLSQFKPTVLAGKPAALETLALAAKSGGGSARDFGVRKLILCGQHSPELRASLEASWGAECFDRYGLTEAGSVASECTAHSGGLHLLDAEFIAESVEPGATKTAADYQPGELVLTTLGRVARPIIRYRTGDLVRLVPDRHCACGLRGAMLLGGVERLVTSDRAD